MPTYSEIQAQIAELRREAEAVRATEIASAQAQIIKIMSTYDLTLADIARVIGKGGKKGTVVAAKYKDPKTGKQWTGRGREPLWLKGKSKSDYLIK